MAITSFSELTGRVTMKFFTSTMVSFEFFPPKTAEGTTQLYETAITLAHCQPQFFSVTFGAGGSTRNGTIETVNMLQHNTNIAVAPHLACIGASREETTDMIMRYKAMGLKRMVALRGDWVVGMDQLGEFNYASELVELIRYTTGDHFYIEVAAYPEIHPQAISVQDDVLNLKRKYEAGANGAITQYFFNPDAYFYYVDDCQKLGISLPIVPGIMPVNQFSKLARFSDMCGAEIQRWLRRRLESYGDDAHSIKQFGLEIVHQLCERLIAGGAPGLHFYTLNKAEIVKELIDMLGLTTLSTTQKVATLSGG